MVNGKAHHYLSPPQIPARGELTPFTNGGGGEAEEVEEDGPGIAFAGDDIPRRQPSPLVPVGGIHAPSPGEGQKNPASPFETVDHAVDEEEKPMVPSGAAGVSNCGLDCDFDANVGWV